MQESVNSRVESGPIVLCGRLQALTVLDALELTGVNPDAEYAIKSQISYHDEYQPMGSNQGLPVILSDETAPGFRRDIGYSLQELSIDATHSRIDRAAATFMLELLGIKQN